MNQEAIKEIELNQEVKEKYIQKLKFCIISHNKALSSRNSLLMFAMENKF